MKCPVDNTTLLITDRSGIEIDHCPDCRGVWLDRGELDKLIQGSVRSEERRYDDRHHDRDDEHDRRSPRDDNRHHKKKESFIGDLFDF